MNRNESRMDIHGYEKETISIIGNKKIVVEVKTLNTLEIHPSLLTVKVNL